MRLFAVCRHRQHQHAQIFVGVAEGALAHDDGVQIGFVDARRFRQTVQRDLIVLEPLAVGLPAPQAFFDFLVGDDAAFDGIHQQHAARLQPAFELDFFRLHGENTGFRRQDHQAIVRHQITRRTQPVAIERRANGHGRR